jgi:patatin-like phospholipase/acyl hydrolase
MFKITVMLMLALSGVMARPIHILSVDGGGVRGIIPAKVLAHIEARLDGNHLTNYFDVMGGTSAGGILVLLLNIPDERGQPLYSANHVITLYKHFTKKVFERTPFYTVRSLNGWVNTKYTSDNIKTIFEAYFKGKHLSDSITNVIIPSYDMKAERNCFFRSFLAKRKDFRNYLAVDVALATSAAPTYFPPVKVINKDMSSEHLLIDGGVSVNNPALCALVHALEIYGPNNDFIVLSIGTGTTFGSRKRNFRSTNPVNHKPDGIELQETKTPIYTGKIDWASNIISILMESVNDVTHYQMMHVVPMLSMHSKYYRLQIVIDPKYSALDDSDPKNVAVLEEYADALIIQNEKVLQKIIRMLKHKKISVS